eukprot:7391228-Prymnesium_polylepis.1
MDSTCWSRHACARGARGERERFALSAAHRPSWLRRRSHLQVLESGEMGRRDSLLHRAVVSACDLLEANS